MKSKRNMLLLTELVKWTTGAAALLDFANSFDPMDLLHLLQVAIVTGKSNRHAAIVSTCQMDFQRQYLAFKYSNCVALCINSFLWCSGCILGS